MTSPNVKNSILGAVLAILVAASGHAQPAAGERDYVITVASAGAADVAADVARIHGGTVIRSGEGIAIVRVSETRERLLAADPRITNVSPVGDEPEQILSGEAMRWSDGVAYRYDGGGNVSQIGPDAHVYDVVGRLVLSRINGISRNYEYDAFGNRTRCVHAMGAPSQSDCQVLTIHSATNKLAGTGRYDEAGNVVSLPGFSYEYDALNMMVEAHAGDIHHEFVYTADDERIASYVANTGAWTWTVRGLDGKPLREFTSGNASSVGAADWQWRRDYVWRDGLLLASRQPNGAGGATTYHYHLDHLGTPRRITDGADAIIGSHDYHAFGPEQSTNTNEPFPSPLKYTGHERDTYGLAALDYMHARYYGPGVGRFLSVDPSMDIEKSMREPQQWNRYSYVVNNPLKYTDPDGKDKFMAWLLGDAFRDVSTWDALKGALSPGPMLNAVNEGRQEWAEDHQAATRGFSPVPTTKTDIAMMPVFMMLGPGGGAARTTLAEAKTLVGAWGKGTFSTLAKTIGFHFEKHGAEVGAKSTLQYLRKAYEFNRNLRGAEKVALENGATRYVKNGYYIIKDEAGRILSYGRATQ
jgi:RHS repeat-associated protein